MRRLFFPTLLILFAGVLGSDGIRTLRAHNWWGLAPVACALSFDLTGLALLERMVRK